MADHKKDKWQKVFCPEDACLAEEEHIALPDAKRFSTNLHCESGRF